MPRGAERGDPTELGSIRNLPDNKGLGFLTKDEQEIIVADIKLAQLGRASAPSKQLKGSVWAVRYVRGTDTSIHRVFVPKEIQLHPSKFENFIDSQTGQDSCFRVRNQAQWRRFIQGQEDKVLQDPQRKTFTIAENIGLLLPAWRPDQRESERYVYNHQLILDHRGKRIPPSEHDCVFFSPLSIKTVTVPRLRAVE